MKPINTSSPGKDIAVFEEPIAMDEAFDEWLVVRKQIAKRAIKQYADRYDLNKNDVKDVSKAMEKIENPHCTATPILLTRKQKSSGGTSMLSRQRRQARWPERCTLAVKHSHHGLKS